MKHDPNFRDFAQVDPARIDRMGWPMRPARLRPRASILCWLAIVVLPWTAIIAYAWRSG